MTYQEPTPQFVTFAVRDGLIRATLGGANISLTRNEATALASALLQFAANPDVRTNRD